MRLRQVKVAMVVLAAVAAIGSSARAQSADALLDLLIKKGVITQREANEVREQLDQQAAQTVELYNKTKVSSWLDSLTFSGDLRLRSEYFDFETIPGTDMKLAPDRWRFRYRLRLAVEAKFVEWATINVRLASGEGGTSATGSDPVSTNHSFTDTFRKKGIYIDVASVTIQPPDWDYGKLIAGKMDIPMWQPRFSSPQVYDYDLTPEGVAEQLQWKFGSPAGAGRYRLFANAGQFSVKEFAANSNDAYMFDNQAGIEARFGKDVKAPKLKLTAVGGYYFTRSLDQVTFVDSPNRGNGISTNGTYLADFDVVYGRGEAAWNISPRPFLGTPATITINGEYDKNLSSTYQDLPDNLTEGWTAQIAFGDFKKKGQWALAYQYKHLDANAVWDAITDSDWGTGGTDRKGHVIKAIYLPQDWWQFSFTAFITEKISDLANSGHNTVGFVGEDLLRLQMDSMLKF